MINNLETYVKLEEELSVDLITFINILKAGKLYHKEFGWLEPDLYFFDTDNPNNWSLDTFDQNGDIRLLYLRDYGKLWALTKEELL